MIYIFQILTRVVNKMHRNDILTWKHCEGPLDALNQGVILKNKLCEPVFE